MRCRAWFVDCKLAYGTVSFSRETVLQEESVEGNWKYFLDDDAGLTWKEVKQTTKKEAWLLGTLARVRGGSAEN